MFLLFFVLAHVKTGLLGALWNIFYPISLSFAKNLEASLKTKFCYVDYIGRAPRGRLHMHSVLYPRLNDSVIVGHSAGLT